MDTVIDKNYEKLLDKNYLTLARNKKIWDLDLPSYLHIVCKTASQSMNTARVSVNIFDDDNQSIRQIAQYVDSSQEENVGKEVLEKKDYPNYFKTYNTARVIDVADTNSDPRTIEFLKHFVSLGIRAVLDVSIHKAGELRGFVWVEHVGGTRVWSEPEKRFLISIGDLVSQRMLDEKLKEETTYFSELSAFHEAIINSSRDSIISVDLDGKIQTINQSAINLLEYSQTDLIDQDLCSFLLTTEKQFR